MKINSIFKLLISIIICELVGIVGGFFTINSIPTWYKALNKPFFSPPNWIFGPVWTMLYFLMGLSLYLIWEKKANGRKMQGIIYFIAQLFFNFSWSIIFFGFRQPLIAFVNIVILWLLIYMTIVKFFKISKTAGILLLPYIIWVSFAALLNLSIVLLN